ncbi:hypothetical protein UFOVP655_49 [uncultured Caudovirales phage]|uniref:Terminase small subunit n=1 Tax=uncultured Caudovirales phage TaxID=2100421 RepID=A0A6J5NB61_9CAUD|nr:hypothetical protein UFOVP655_49 [uncultured Caudovirales phage]
MAEKKPVKKAAAKPRVKRVTPAKLGKPGLLNQELQEKIVELIRLGNYAEDAAGAVGIGRTTFFLWMARGKAEAERLKLIPDAEPIELETPYVDFMNAVEKARDEATARNVAVIQRAAHNGTWQAAAWFLERTRQNTYGRKERVEMTGQDGEPMKMVVDVGDLEQKIAQVMAKRSKK